MSSYKNLKRGTNIPIIFTIILFVFTVLLVSTTGTKHNCRLQNSGEVNYLKTSSSQQTSEIRKQIQISSNKLDEIIYLQNRTTSK